MGIAKTFGIETIADLYYYFKQYGIGQTVEAYKKTRERKKNKIFVIGLNKTGTTTVESALMEFDLIMGRQKIGEILTKDVLKGKRNLLRLFCKTAEAFQDLPFSVPDIYRYLDKAYPESKFILTVRNDANQWFESLVNFHKKIFGDGEVPSEAQLYHSNFLKPGYALHILKTVYGESLYNKENYAKVYDQHIKDVTTYFKDRNQQLLTINVAEDNSYQKLCEFIGVEPKRDSFEWKNKTSQLPSI